MGPNDGGIKRGDSAETGDLEARETDSVDRDGSGAHGGGGATAGFVTGAANALGTGVTHTHATKLDSLAGSTLSPDQIADVANSLDEDPDLGGLQVEGNVSNDEVSVDDWTPSDED